MFIILLGPSALFNFNYSKISFINLIDDKYLLIVCLCGVLELLRILFHILCDPSSVSFVAILELRSGLGIVDIS